MSESPSTQPRPTLTVVQNSPDAPLGALAAVLDAHAHVRVLRPFDGDALPSAFAAGAGLVVLGGSQHALDDAGAPWLPELRTLLADAVALQLPTLAIGLGAQLLALACGGRVALAPPPGHEAGVIELAWRPEAAQDPMFGELARRAGVDDGTGPAPRGDATLAASMHGDAIVSLPDAATWLASSPTYPFQAFRIASAVGVQFRPEADADLLARWALAVPGVDAPRVELDAIAQVERLTELTQVVGRAFVNQARAAVAGMPSAV